MKSLAENLLNDLREEFEGFIFEFQEINLKGIIPVFFIRYKCDSENYISNNWENITEFIAVNFQTSIENEFSVWNIYVFFIINFPISNDLKYKIENDTFSSRKIVVENDDNLTQIIKEHILNDDLRINTSEQIDFKDSLERNLILWSVLSNQEATQKVGNESKNSFAEIVKNLKNQNNEI